jgi:hypothetical protein
VKIIHRAALVLISLVTFGAVLPAQTSDRTLYSVPTGIEGTISISPARGGPTRVGVPNSRPLANKDFVATDGQGTETAFKTDEHGHFRVMLAPGRYRITPRQKSRIGGCKMLEVDVAAGAVTRVDWNCDSGMR